MALGNPSLAFTKADICKCSQNGRDALHHYPGIHSTVVELCVPLYEDYYLWPLFTATVKSIKLTCVRKLQKLTSPSSMWCKQNYKGEESLLVAAICESPPMLGWNFGCWSCPWGTHDPISNSYKPTSSLSWTWVNCIFGLVWVTHSASDKARHQWSRQYH